MNRVLICIVIAGLCAPPALDAQDLRTPESAARSYFAATRAGDVDRAATLMHPDALRQLRRTFEIITAADSSGQVLRTMFGVASAAEFRALTPAQTFARLYRSLMRSPQLRDAMSAMETVIVGHVGEPPDLAHVVYRMTVPVAGATVSKTEVISFKRSGGEWRAMLTGDLQGVIQQLSRMSRRN